MKLVLIDDNFAVRFILKSLLAEQFSGSEVFTAQDGVQGLGLIYATDPEVIVIDATLPKYSGREVVDFIISSPRLNSRKVIVLTDGSYNIKNQFPQNFSVIEKKDSEFFNKFLSCMGNDAQSINRLSKLKLVFRKTLLKLSNTHDIIRWRMGKTLFNKIFLFFPWILNEIISSLILAILLITTHKGKDANIAQSEEDLKKFRVQVYPTLVALIAGIFILICQVALFIAGGIIIFNNVRIESVFADFSREVYIDLEKSEFNTALIEIVDGKLQLKEQFEPQESLELNSLDKEIPSEELFGLGNLPNTDPTPLEPVEITENLSNEALEIENSEEQLESSSLPDNIIQTTPAVTETPVKQSEPISGSVEGESIELISKGYTTTSPAVIFTEPVTFSALAGILDSVYPSLNNTVLEANQSLVSGVTYQFSPDKTNWYYYGSNGWEKTESGWAGSNLARTVSGKMDELGTIIGGNTLYVKAFLNSDGKTPTSLSSLLIERELQVVYSVKDPVLVEEEKAEVKIFNLEEPVSYLPVSETPISFTKDIENTSEAIVNIPLPVIYQASFANGNKVVYGKTSQIIKDELINRFSVKIYYDSGEFIGESELKNNVRGETVFILKTPNRSGGYVYAEIELKDKNGIVIKKERSQIMENSTFSVDTTGDEADDTPGDGLCATSIATCTLKAAIEEANALAGNDNIYFNIPELDSGYRDYDDPSTPGSGDSLGGDDYWTIETSGFDAIIEGINLDAATQTTNVGNFNLDGPEIEISVYTPGIPIFNLNGADNTTINGFVLNNSHSAIWIPDGANITQLWVLENYIALDARGIGFKYFENNGSSTRPGCITYEGTAPVTISNFHLLNNTIGQPFCLRLDSTPESYIIASEIKGNYFGLNRLGNAGTGFGSNPTTTFNNISQLEIGGSIVGEKNIFAGNATGQNSTFLGIVSTDSISDLTISYNYFGLDPTGLLERSGNISSAILISADQATNVNIGPDNVIGGLVCSSCSSAGINVANNSGIDLNFSNFVINGNTFGLVADGLTSSTLSLGSGITLAGPLGGMEISENFCAGGITAGCIFFDSDTSNTTVLGNVFGLNTAFAPVSISPGVNEVAGISFTQNALNISDINIGDGTLSGRNIFGDLGIAISFTGSDSSSLNNLSIKGNYFGLDNTGTIARVNTGVNIYISCPGSCTNLSIGGSNPGEGNIISNGLRGVHFLNATGLSTVWDNIEIKGNIIGSNEGGIENFGNKRGGVVFQTSQTTVPGNFLVSGNLIRFNNLEEGVTASGYLSSYGGIQFQGSLHSNQLVIEDNDISDNKGDGILILNHPGFGVVADSSTNWPIIRNNIIGAGTGRVIADLPLGGNLKNGIGTFIAVSQLYGNTIKGNNQYGVFSFGYHLDPNIYLYDISPSRLLIGGQALLAGSLCNGLEANCISDNSWGGIISVDSLPQNESTIYVDNDFSTGNGNNENVVQSWSGFFELFSGNIRRTDLADEYINLNIPSTNIVQQSLDPSSRVQTISNFLQNCSLAGYCPASGATSGENNKSEVFALNPVPLDAYYWPLLRGTFVEYIIDQSGNKLDYSVYKIDQNHIAQGEAFSTDGDSTSQPQTLTDRAHPWTFDQTATRDYATNSLGVGTAIELEMVDANPIWNGSQWIITVDTTLVEDNVSLLGFDDGAGSYSGGGVNGPDGIANGRTSYLEAAYVASVFANPVQIVFDPITAPGAPYPINLTAPLNGATVTVNRPTLSWTASTDPWIGSYDVYLNSNLLATISHPITTYTVTTDLAPGNYTWHVVAKRLNNSQSAVSTTSIFAISDISFPITLISPNNNAALADFPVLEWQASTDPLIATYEIYLNTNYLATVAHPATAYTFTSSLASGNYTWHIVAKRANNFQSGISETRAFSFNFPIVLVSPLQNELVTSFPTLKWLESLDPLVTGYKIFVNELEVAQVESNVLQYTLSNLHATSGQNRWQIVGVKADNSQSGFSEIREFTLNIPVQTTVSDIPVVPISLTQTSRTRNSLTVIDTVATVSPILVAVSISAVTGIALSSGGHQVLKGLMVLGLLIPRKRKYWGIIVDLSQNKPLPFANIVAQNLANTNEIYKTVSDTEGKYFLKVINNGNYKLEVFSNGYLSYETAINVTNGAIVSDIALVKLENVSLLSRFKKLSYYSKTEIFNIIKIALGILVLFGFGYTISSTLVSFTTVNLLLLILYILIIVINIPVFLNMGRIKEGRVLKATDQSGIQGVVARLYNNKFDVVDVKISNKDGSLRFNAANGTHFISCWKQGYRLDQQNNRVIEKGLLKIAEVGITNKGVVSDVYLSENLPENQPSANANQVKNKFFLNN